MKTKKRNYIFLAVLMMGIATMMTGCAKEDIASNDNGGGTNPTDMNVDELSVKVTADIPTAVMSSFDENSMGAALVRRLNIKTNEVTSDTKMILIKGEDILNRPLTEWLEAAKIYLRGGYIAVPIRQRGRTWQLALGLASPTSRKGHNGALPTRKRP